MLDLSLLHQKSLESGYTAVRSVPNGIDLSGGQVIGLNGEETFVLDAGIFSYQPPNGTAALREAYGATLHRNQKIAPSTLVTAGAKQALFLALAFFGPRVQRVFVPAPGWSPYALLARALGFEPQGYDPCDATALADLVCKAPESLVVLNYPHNPTGACLSAGHLNELVNAARASGSQIVSDEVYRALVPNAPSAAEYLSTGLVTVVDSISKWAGAAGLRVGFLVGSAELLEHSLSLIGMINSGTCSIAQSWAAHHLTSPRLIERAAKASERSIVELEKDLIRSGHSVVSSGAIYLWVKGGPTFRIDGHEVTGVPGDLFGQQGFSRLCPTASANPWNALARERDTVQ